jgi:5'-nucleotidase
LIEDSLILITNDDGIASPGLAAAAAAMEDLGKLLIVAPLHQQTSMGRSRILLPHQNGRIQETVVRYLDKEWPAYSVDATPALVVEAATNLIASKPVSFAVSGINYGENIGTCITVSGTVGAAMEAAEKGIHSLAISLEIPGVQYDKHDTKIDFSTALFFTRFIASKLIRTNWPADVDVLKVEIPATASIESSWEITCQDKISYYSPQIKMLKNRGYSYIQVAHVPAKGSFFKKGSDAHALAKGIISITPLSLDFTSRLNFSRLQGMFKG